MLNSKITAISHQPAIMFNVENLFHEENLSLFQERCNRAHFFAHMETNFSFFHFQYKFTLCTTGGTDLGNLLQGGEAYVKLS